MKVAIWGINYAPEVTGIGPYNTALAEYLVAQGHDVEMITTFAYYPAWKKASEDLGKMYRTEIANGVKVHRCWHYVPSQVSTIKRIVHEGSFVVSSFLRQLVAPRPDVRVVISPPLLLGAAAWFLGIIRPAPFVFHVQDLQPDAAAALGMMRSGRLMRLLYSLERFAYQKAARVCGIMGGMMDAFRSKGVPEGKLVEFPNGVNLLSPEAIPAPGKFRAAHDFHPEDFLVVYSGNLGVKQGLDVLIAAARLVKNPRVQLVLCGQGAERAKLEAMLANEKRSNVRLLNLLPAAEYHEMLVDADVCAISQQAGSGKYFFPSKLLTTLSFSRPVVTVADPESDLTRALDQGGFGVNIPPGNPEELAAVLDRLSANREQLLAMSGRARDFVKQFSFGRVLGDFSAELKRVIG